MLEQFQYLLRMQFFNSIVEVGTVSTAAKAVISGLKAIPGVNLAVGIVNAIIAGSFVAAIGKIILETFVIKK